jgi:transcription initiation factor TFIIB
VGFKLASNPNGLQGISQVWLDYSQPADQTEKNFAFTIAEIIRITGILSMQPSIAEQAAKICGQAFFKGLSRGNPLSTLAAAAVYASAKLQSIPTTAEEVATKSDLAKSEVVHCFRKLQRNLNLSFPTISLHAYANRILRQLSLQSDAKLIGTVTKFLLQIEKENGAQGRNPSAVAAAAIYVATLHHSNVQYNLTQRKLAQAANVTETTIRRACRNLH